MPDPIVSITLMGAPKGKGRPRLSTIGGFARAYTPKETREFERVLNAAAIEAMAGRPYYEGPVSVVIRAFMPIPESWSAKKKAAALAMDLMPVTKPDLDNIEKMVDALSKYPPRFKGDKEKRPLIWKDDSFIVAKQSIKIYSDRPRLVIDVWGWDVGAKEDQG